ncbi:MAG: efflux RND transporter periplasmic adaptor subunit [Xenococcus sp. MO_188.B8]|nr:efflux RND transporter periplasmic adaptor subunit [Xenococcus sp. MO_188.B8]
MDKHQVQFKNWQLLILTVLLLGSGFIFGQKYQPRLSINTQAKASKTDHNQVNILPVETIVVRQVYSYSTSQTYIGEVKALRTSEVGFERAGKLISVLVDEGDRVSAGTALAKLDTTNLETQLEGLIARKAGAQAVLAELKNGARTEQKAAAQAVVRDLEQQLELEKLKNSRREYLYGEGAIAREQLDEVAFNSKALTERLANAKSNLEELQNGTRVEQVTAQQAVVDRLTAEIKDISITIDKSILRSPFNSIVSNRNVDEGMVIQAGQSILRLVENTQPELKVGVPISVANQIKSGSRHQVTIGGEIYSAEVSSILPELNSATRTLTVVLKLPSLAATQVIPGQIARLAVTQTHNTDGYWLPITALVKGNRGLWSCYALVDSEHSQNTKVEVKSIEILEAQSDRVLVRGTLEPGDEIIADGTHRLVPGQLANRK